MTITRTTNRKFIKFAIIVIAALIIVSYAIFRSLNYAKGPQITISFPVDGYATTSKLLGITGRADRVTDISLNGRLITVNESGDFAEDLILFQGINVISFVAHDQFGRSVSKEMRVVGN